MNIIYDEDFKVKEGWFYYIKSYIFIALFSVLMAVIASLLFGYKYFIVNGWSAETFIHYGSLIMVKNTDSVELGDFVTYKNSANNHVTHRVYEIREDGSFVVCQTGTGGPRTTDVVVPGENMVGKVVFVIPYANKVLSFLKGHYLEIIIFVFGMYYVKKYFSKLEEYDPEKGEV